jgi:uncharacterized protein YndB with AHSA1/START domain
MTQQAARLTVSKTITVDADREHAFRVFTDEIGSWWPFDTKAIGQVPATTAVLEPRAGGRWFERGEDGSECEWGRVVAFEPPERLVLNWQIGADWRYDPTLETEVEIRFSAEDAGRTRVDLEHRGLEAYGEQAEQMKSIFDSPAGWGELLGLFAAAAVAG